MISTLQLQKKSQLSFELEHLHIMNLTIINMKAEGGTDDMETLDSRSAGIDCEHVVMRVAHYLEDVRMAADEDVGTVIVDEFACAQVVAAGVTPDMGDEDSHAFTGKKPVQRLGIAQVIIVAVARYTHQGLESGDLLRKLKPASEIPRMPDLIDRLQKLPDPLVEHAMRI